MTTPLKLHFAAAMLSLSGAAYADITVQMNNVDEKGVSKPAGQVVISETIYGLVLTPSLSGLPPGVHGFHFHENASCEAKEKDGKMVAALGAGGHYDPAGSKRHGLPWGDGHLGDLPSLSADSMGNVTSPVLAPRLKKLGEIKARALMLHAGGDNHSDHPSPLGGGGMRLICGVVQ